MSETSRMSDVAPQRDDTSLTSVISAVLDNSRTSRLTWLFGSTGVDALDSSSVFVIGSQATAAVVCLAAVKSGVGSVLLADPHAEAETAQQVASSLPAGEGKSVKALATPWNLSSATQSVSWSEWTALSAWAKEERKGRSVVVVCCSPTEVPSSQATALDKYLASAKIPGLSWVVSMAAPSSSDSTGLVQDWGIGLYVRPATQHAYLRNARSPLVERSVGIVDQISALGEGNRICVLCEDGHGLVAGDNVVFQEVQGIKDFPTTAVRVTPISVDSFYFEADAPLDVSKYETETGMFLQCDSRSSVVQECKPLSKHSQLPSVQTGGSIAPFAQSVVGGLAADQALILLSGAYRPLPDQVLVRTLRRSVTVETGKWSQAMNAFAEARFCLVGGAGALGNECLRQLGALRALCPSPLKRGRALVVDSVAEKDRACGRRNAGDERKTSGGAGGPVEAPVYSHHLTSHSLLGSTGKSKLDALKDWSAGQGWVVGSARYVCAKDPDSLDAKTLDGFDVVLSCADHEADLRFVKSQCVYAQRACVEGVLGSWQGRCRAWVPHATSVNLAIPTIGVDQGPVEEDNPYPLCVMKNFPYAPHHCALYAVQLHRTLFLTQPQLCNEYIKDAQKCLTRLEENPSTQEAQLGVLGRYLNLERPLTFDDCVAWSLRLFVAEYRDRASLLLFRFPADHWDAKNERFFWRGHKRACRPVEFDPQSVVHLSFLLAGAILYGALYGLQPPSKPLGSEQELREYVTRIVTEARIPKWSPPTTKVAIELPDGEEDTSEEQDGIVDPKVRLKRLLRDLPESSELAGSSLRPQRCSVRHGSNLPLLGRQWSAPQNGEREYPDTRVGACAPDLVGTWMSPVVANMLFVWAAANMRAQVYRIPAIPVDTARYWVSKEPPTTVGSAAAVAGLMCGEAAKAVLCQSKMSPSPYQCVAFDQLKRTPPADPIDPALALQMDDGEGKAAPIPVAKPPVAAVWRDVFPEAPTVQTVWVGGDMAKKVGGSEWSFSEWDQLQIDLRDSNNSEGGTLKTMLDHIKAKYGWGCSLVTYGDSTLFFDFGMGLNPVMKKRLNQTLPSIINEVVKDDSQRVDTTVETLTLEFCMMDDDEEDLEVPAIKVRIR